MSRFNFLHAEGIKTPGENGYNMLEKPEWYDEEEYQKGCKIIKRYTIGVYLSSIMGSVFMSQYDHLMAPLVATGNFKRLEVAKRRVANTFQHAFKWIEGDMFNREDPAFKSLLIVRGMHQRVAKKLNETGQYPRVDDGLWLSQFEMNLTIFAAKGFFFLYPKELGVFATDDELQAVAFVWRVIGRQMGIRDEFNMCQGSIKDIREVCLDIVEHVKPTLLQPKAEYTTILKNTLIGVGGFSYFIDYAAFLNWTSRLVDLEIRLPLSWYGTACEMFYEIGLKALAIPFIRDIVTPLYKKFVSEGVDNYLKDGLKSY